jgi:hypothetical protein
VNIDQEGTGGRKWPDLGNVVRLQRVRIIVCLVSHTFRQGEETCKEKEIGIRSYEGGRLAVAGQDRADAAKERRDFRSPRR